MGCQVAVRLAVTLEAVFDIKSHYSSLIQVRFLIKIETSGACNNWDMSQVITQPPMIRTCPKAATWPTMIRTCPNAQLLGCMPGYHLASNNDHMSQDVIKSWFIMIRPSPKLLLSPLWSQLCVALPSDCCMSQIITQPPTIRTCPKLSLSLQWSGYTCYNVTCDDQDMFQIVTWPVLTGHVPRPPVITAHMPLPSGQDMSQDVIWPLLIRTCPRLSLNLLWSGIVQSSPGLQRSEYIPSFYLACDDHDDHKLSPGLQWLGHVPMSSLGLLWTEHV